MATSPGRGRRGSTAWSETPDEHLDWQRSRYRSGLFLTYSLVEWEEAIAGRLILASRNPPPLIPPAHVLVHTANGIVREGSASRRKTRRRQPFVTEWPGRPGPLGLAIDPEEAEDIRLADYGDEPTWSFPLGYPEGGRPGDKGQG